MNKTKEIEMEKMDILTKKFDNIDYINDLLNYYVNNHIPIEIKKCEYMTKSGNKKHPKRFGRFSLDKDKHEFLVRNKGYYLFLVYHNNFVISVKIMEANDITFSKLKTWHGILETPQFTIDELEVYIND